MFLKDVCSAYHKKVLICWDNRNIFHNFRVLVINKKSNNFVCSAYHKKVLICWDNRNIFHNFRVLVIN